MNPRPRKLLDQVRDVMQEKHYSIRTERAYVNWIKRYVLFHDKRHPREMGGPEIEAFIVHLAVDQNVAASTQNQALSALLFLYHQVLEIDLGPVDAVRAKRPRRLPNVLTREEVMTIIAATSGTNQLITQLLYGAGLRLIECLRLRVHDVDFDYHQIIVRNGKGRTNHVTMLPESLVQPLQIHLQHVEVIHQRDLDDGYGTVYLPPTLEEKYPDTHREWCWQYLFPASKLSTDPRSGVRRRHHLGESGPQKAIRKATQSVGIAKRISCQTLRHCFATHLLEDGYDVRTVQELLGHKNPETTMIYTSLLDRGGLAVRSPLD